MLSFGSLTADPGGAVLVADRANCRVRRFVPGGEIETIAGNGGCGYSGDGADAMDASLRQPSDVALASDGGLYIADTGNCRIRRVETSGTITTIAGSETWGEGDNWTAAQTASAVTKVPGGYQLDGIRKSYVTSAGHATHFQFHCRVGEDSPQSAASRLFVAADEIDWEILEPWNGLGMRGNSSSPVKFSGFVPEENHLDEEHTIGAATTHFARPVVALTYAAAYLGIASGTYE